MGIARTSQGNQSQARRRGFTEGIRAMLFICMFLLVSMFVFTISAQAEEAETQNDEPVSVNASLDNDSAEPAGSLSADSEDDEKEAGAQQNDGSETVSVEVSDDLGDSADEGKDDTTNKADVKPVPENQLGSEESETAQAPDISEALAVPQGEEANNGDSVDYDAAEIPETDVDAPIETPVAAKQAKDTAEQIATTKPTETEDDTVATEPQKDAVKCMVPATESVKEASSTKVAPKRVSVAPGAEGDKNGKATDAAKKKIRLKRVQASNAIYTGKAITPEITVKAGGKVLVQDVDYQLVLSNNVQEGRASVVVVGIGNYEGKLSTSFRIFGKPKFSGASKMPVRSQTRLIIVNAKVKVVSGGTKVKLKGKKLTAIRRGKAKLAIYNKLGERVDTKEISVYRPIAGVRLRLAGSKKLYLDIADGSLSSGAGAVLQKKASKNSQLVLLKRAKGKSYMLITESGKALQPNKKSKRNGTAIVQAKAKGTSAQRWNVVVDEKGRLTFVNLRTHKALGVEVGSATLGSAVRQQKKDQVKEQKWSVVVPKAKYSGATVLYENSIAPWTARGVKMTITKGKQYASFKKDSATGNLVLRGKQKGKATLKVRNALGELLTVANIDVRKLSGQYYLNTALDYGMTLEAEQLLEGLSEPLGFGGQDICFDDEADPNVPSEEQLIADSSKHGAELTERAEADFQGLGVHSSKGTDNTKFTFKDNGDKTFTIGLVSTGNVLEVDEGSIENGANVSIARSTGSSAQRWRVVVDSRNRVTFVNKRSGLALSLQGGSATSGTNVCQSRVRNSDAQKFNLVSLKVLQKPANPKQNAIATAAAKYAYSQPVYYNHKTANKGTALYQRLCNAIFPGFEKLSCDRGVACAARWTGADESYPSGTPAQYKHLKKSSNWTFLGRWSGNEADLQPGDVLIRTKNMAEKSTKLKTNHTCVYIGKSIAQSVYKRYLKETDADKGIPAEDATFVSAHRSRDNRNNATAACIGSAKFAHADQRMVVFRCTNRLFGSKYSHLL